LLPLKVPPVTAAAALLAAAAMTGCQSYQPRPLDPEAHRSAWSQRTPAEAPVLELAQRLGFSAPIAPSFDPTDGISATEGELVALVYNADLRLARLRAGVARAIADHAGRWDDPQVGIEILRVTRGVPDPWIVAPSLSLTLPISGRLRAERARADAVLRADLERIAEEEWRIGHELRVAWLAWSADVLRERELESMIASLELLVTSTRRLAELGEIPRTEASLFAIEQVRRRAEIRRLRARIAEGGLTLRSIMGLMPDLPIELIPALPPLSADAEEEPPAAIDRNPSLLRLREEYQVAEETLRREIRKQYPDLTIGPRFESDQGQSRIGLGAGISLPIFNANRQGIAAAAAERELARAAYEAEAERLTAALAMARVRRRALREAADEVLLELVPLVDRQLADARRLLELGEGNGLILLEAIAGAHESRSALIDLHFEFARTRAELLFLRGPADPPSPEPTEYPVAAQETLSQEVTP
jgi:outer membrane protein, heavy metal efflux system